MAVAIRYLYFKSPDYSLSQKDILATLTQSKESVKLKRLSLFTWKNANSGDPLSLGDKVYTHRESTAEIKFKDGNAISLNPLSLLEIRELKNNENGLVLTKGSFNATLNDDKPITIVLGERVIELKGDKTKIRIDQNKENKKASITVLKGKVKVGKKVIEAANFTLTETTRLDEIKETKHHYQINADKLPTRLLENQKFTLDINQISPTKNPQILVSLNGKRLSSQKLGEIKLKNSGDYDFEIQESGKTVSPKVSASIQVLSLANIDLKREHLPLYENELIPLKINSLYDLKVQILKEGRPIKEGLVKAQKSDLKPLPIQLGAGDYELIFTPKEEDLSGPSQTLSLKINNAPTLAAPKLLLEQDRFVFYGSKERAITLNIKSENQLIRKDTPEVYRLFYSTQEEGKVETLITEKTTTLKISPPDHKISLKLRAEQSLFYSPMVEKTLSFVFKQALESFPLTGATIELEKPQQLVNFTWEKPNDPHTGFLFEVSKDQNFKSGVFTKKTTNNNIETTLPEAGTYYWRSRYISPDKKLILGKPTQITIKPAPPPKPIKLQKTKKIKLKRKLEEGRRSSSLNSLPVIGKFRIVTYLVAKLLSMTHAAPEETFEALITWPKERLAKRYYIEIFKSKNDQTPLFSSEIEKPEVLWDKALPGTFYYRVAIIDYWERKGDFSNWSTLSLLPPENKDISLVNPPHKRELVWENTKFSFKGDENLEATIEFSYDLSFNEPLISINIPKGKDFVTLKTSILRKKLKGKAAYWRISQGQKKNVKKSKRRKISFAKIPLEKESRPKRFGDFIFFQKTSQTSVSQEDQRSNISASGFLAMHLGLEWQGSPIDIPLSFRAQMAIGKAFEVVDYSQNKVQLFWERYGYFGNFPWSQKYGLEYQGQTLFNESIIEGVQAEDVSIFFVATEQTLFLNPKSSLNLGLAVGQGISYSLSYQHQLKKLWRFNTQIGAFVEGLMVTGESSTLEKDFTRNNFGLSLSFLY